MDNDDTIHIDPEPPPASGAPRPRRAQLALELDAARRAARRALEQLAERRRERGEPSQQRRAA